MASGHQTCSSLSVKLEVKLATAWRGAQDIDRGVEGRRPSPDLVTEDMP